MDNLNIHELSCLYEAFEPSEARRLVQRFEVHHTPKLQRSPEETHPCARKRTPIATAAGHVIA
jgi:hypothetical protein